MKVTFHPICTVRIAEEEETVVLEISDTSYVPLTTRRAERTDLLPKLPSVHKILNSIFKQDITVTYNLRDILNNLRFESNTDEMQYIRRWYSQEGILNAQAPTVVSDYLEYAALGLEKMKFGSDMLLGASWLEAAPRGVLFEVVLKLKSLVGFSIFFIGICDAILRIVTGCPA